jgi:putative sterol carrier protein
MDPQELAQLVKTSSSDELKQLMHGERRAAILDEIFAWMPGQFRPERAGATSAVIHWNVGDRPDGGTDTYELVIANGTCELSPQPEHEPQLALTLGAVDFLKVVTGNAKPVALFMTGKLKAKGDLGLASAIANLFDLPKG